jgi:hypothetical protein
MQKRFGWMFAVLSAALLLLIGVVQGQESSAPDAPRPPHVVINMTDSSATLSRMGWSTLAPVAVGMEVQTTDLIDPGIGEVTVLCADLQIVVIFAVASPPNCNDDVTGPDFAIPVRRGGQRTPNVAYLISPRFYVLSEQPNLRWASVPDAASYTVQLISGGRAVWSSPIIVTEARLDFPPDQSPLTPGIYTVNITAINASGASVSTAETPPPTFIVLQTEDRAKITDTLASVSFPARIDSSELAFSRAVYYAQYKLYSEAIDLIAPYLSSESGSPLANSPFPYLTLGDWYAELNLLTEAAAAYEVAITKAGEQANTLCSARAYDRLSEVITDDALKACHLKRARQYYETIGDQDAVTLMGEKLAALGAVDSACP